MIIKDTSKISDFRGVFVASRHSIGIFSSIHTLPYRHFQTKSILGMAENSPFTPRNEVIAGRMEATSKFLKGTQSSERTNGLLGLGQSIASFFPNNPLHSFYNSNINLMSCELLGERFKYLNIKLLI